MFVPALLTSTCVIYNTITAGGASKTTLLTEVRSFVAAAKRVQRKSGDARAADDLARPAFGHLHVVIRDVSRGSGQ